MRIQSSHIVDGLTILIGLPLLWMLMPHLMAWVFAQIWASVALIADPQTDLFRILFRGISVAVALALIFLVVQMCRCLIAHLVRALLENRNQRNELGTH